MKSIVVVMLFLMSFSLIGQERLSKEERQALLDERKALEKYDPRDSLDYPTRYCLLLATGKFLSNKVDITIDYGQDASYFEDKRIRDRNGKIIIFNSVMDALNYMDSLGWSFVTAYAITIGNQNVYHYLLKSDENTEMDFIPKTKKDFRRED